MKSRKQLEQEIMDLKIHNHKESYIHIPFSWAGFGRFLLLLGSIGLAIANIFLIISVWKILGIDSINSEKAGFYQLLICYPIIGEYILIGLSFICLVAVIKGGFDKVKGYGKSGLIWGLIWGFWGLICGLICGFWGLIREFE